MKRRSVFLNLALRLFLFSIVYWVGTFFYFANEAYKRETARMMIGASEALKVSRILILNNEVPDLSMRLNEAMKAGSIDFYLIRRNHIDLDYSNVAGANDPIVFPNKPEGIYKAGNYRVFILRQGEYYLCVGHKTTPWGFLRHYFDNEKQVLLADLIYVLLCVMSIVLYSFRDFRRIVARLTSRGAKRGDVTLAESKETLALVQGLKGFENTVQSLERANMVLLRQVLPSLRTELQSGKKPPYTFECTMARTDINNYSETFSKYDKDQYMDVVNEFFIGVSHIISRYGGLVHEFLGDEIIYYFKDEDSPNSSAIAISAVRDINALADNIDSRVRGSFGYNFKVKSSLSWGLIRFGPLVDGFSIGGAPLIETVRILSHVHEKTVNTVLMSHEVRTRIGDLCAASDGKVVVLKGIGGSHRLHVYENHVPLAHHLRQGTSDSFSKAIYYRSDDEISETLRYVQDHWREVDPDKASAERSTLLQLLVQLRSIRLTQASSEVRSSFLELCHDLSDEVARTGAESASFLLASVIAVVPPLFPAEAFTGRLRESLLSCMALPNSRIVANTLDVFAELAPEAADQAFESIANSSDNRIAANRLIKEGRKDWNRKVARKLEAMLAHKSPYFKASGLFALGEIALANRTIDPIAYHADTRLQRLLSEIPKFAIHQNAMVRRQALRASAKAERVDDLRGILTGSVLLSLEAKNEIRAFIEREASSDSPMRRDTAA